MPAVTLPRMGTWAAGDSPSTRMERFKPASRVM